MQALGFTQYESQVYLALLQQANVSGYELAKNSGVPASKIYATLHKLIDKEMILVIDGEPKKYVPIPPEEILKRLKDDYLHAIDDLQPKLEHLYTQDAEVGNYIWNLSGRKLIISKIREFINKAQSKIYLSVWDEEIDELADALTLASHRDVKMQVVHFGKKILNIGREYRHGREHQIRVERGGRRIALIVDDQFVILGHFLEDGSSSALWTTNKGLVLLAKDYIIHDIYSIKMVEKFGAEANSIFEMG
jgi:sugar-specific transcriptional regulator TrmB